MAFATHLTSNETHFWRYLTRKQCETELEEWVGWCVSECAVDCGGLFFSWNTALTHFEEPFNVNVEPEGFWRVSPSVPLAVPWDKYNVNWHYRLHYHGPKQLADLWLIQLLHFDERLWRQPFFRKNNVHWDIAHNMKVQKVDCDLTAENMPACRRRFYI